MLLIISIRTLVLTITLRIQARQKELFTKCAEFLGIWRFILVVAN